MYALVDGDVVVYRCAFAAEHHTYELYVPDEEGLLTFERAFPSHREMKEYIKQNGITEYEVYDDHQVDPVTFATQAANTCLEGIMAGLGATGIQVFLSNPKCFRNDIATIKKYKGNRDNVPRPVHYDAVREHLVRRWGAIMAQDGLEADDELAIWSARDPDNVIVTIDKDLDQVPGWHYNWTLEENKLYYIDADVGDYKLFSQILTGDATDNIPGLPRFGPKKAAAVLDGVSPSDYLDVVREKYEELWPEDSPLSPAEAMDETAQLVYILREYGDSWDNYKRTFYGQ